MRFIVIFLGVFIALNTIIWLLYYLEKKSDQINAWLQTVPEIYKMMAVFSIPFAVLALFVAFSFENVGGYKND